MQCDMIVMRRDVIVMRLDALPCERRQTQDTNDQATHPHLLTGTRPVEAVRVGPSTDNCRQFPVSQRTERACCRNNISLGKGFRSDTDLRSTPAPSTPFPSRDNQLVALLALVQLIQDMTPGTGTNNF
jgi:hypothetical protein